MKTHTHLKRRALGAALTLAGCCIGLYLCAATLIWAMGPGSTYP